MLILQHETYIHQRHLIIAASNEEKVLHDRQIDGTLSEMCGKLGQTIILIPSLWCTVPSRSTVQLCIATYLMYSIVSSTMEASLVCNIKQVHAQKKGSNYPPFKEESYALGLSVNSFQ
jgi:hypothetical protein